MTMSSGRKDGFEPRSKQNRKIERRQSALAHDHGMNELHRNVLGIGGVRAASEGQKPAAAQKSL